MLNEVVVWVCFFLLFRMLHLKEGGFCCDPKLNGIGNSIATGLLPLPAWNTHSTPGGAAAILQPGSKSREIKKCPGDLTTFNIKLLLTCLLQISFLP